MTALRTLLQERHRPAFATLTAEQSARVWSCVLSAWPIDFKNESNDPSTPPGRLFETLRDAGLDHARVVLSLAQQTDDVGRGAIEGLIGRAIKPWSASVEAEAAADPREGLGALKPLARTKSPGWIGPRKRVDLRIVVRIEENPHEAGTGMHKSYEHWAIGKTVEQCVALGLTSRSVRRDIRRGFVRVEGVADPTLERRLAEMERDPSSTESAAAEQVSDEEEGEG